MTQMSRMDKLIMRYSQNEILYSNENEQIITTHSNTAEAHK